jgi:hypothetical protein
MPLDHIELERTAQSVNLADRQAVSGSMDRPCHVPSASCIAALPMGSMATFSALRHSLSGFGRSS